MDDEFIKKWKPSYVKMIGDARQRVLQEEQLYAEPYIVEDVTKQLKSAVPRVNHPLSSNPNTYYSAEVSVNMNYEACESFMGFCDDMMIGAANEGKIKNFYTLQPVNMLSHIHCDIPRYSMTNNLRKSSTSDGV